MESNYPQPAPGNGPAPLPHAVNRQAEPPPPEQEKGPPGERAEGVAVVADDTVPFGPEDASRNTSPPPPNVRAEETLLATALQRPELLSEILERCPAKQFRDRRCSELARLLESGCPAEVTVIASRIDPAGTIATASTPGTPDDWLAELLNRMPATDWKSVAAEVTTGYRLFESWKIHNRLGDQIAAGHLPDLDDLDDLRAMNRTSEPEPAPMPLGDIATALEPWPWDALPSPMRDMGEAMARTMGTSAELAGAVVLGIASIACRNCAMIEIKENHRQYPNLYLLAVVPPAEGKTPAMKRAAAPLADWENSQLPKYQKSLAEWNARESMREVRKKAAKRTSEQALQKNLQADTSEQQEELTKLESEVQNDPRPAPPQLTTSDCTSEALARLLQGHGEAFAVLSSEGRKMLAIAAGRYVEGGDFDLWLAGTSGDKIDVNRQTGEPVRLKHPVLSALLLTQPDAVQALGNGHGNHHTSGFLARFFYIVPDPVGNDYSMENVPESAASAWRERILELLNLPTSSDAPPIITMTPEARNLWLTYHDELKGRNGEIRSADMSDELKTWLGKLPEQVSRLALVLHLAGGGSEALHRPVQKTTLAAACALGNVFRSHAIRAYSIIGGSKVVSVAEKIGKWFKNRTSREPLRPSDIVRHGIAGIKTANEAEPALDYLAAKGWLRMEEKPNPGARPSRLYHPNPRLWEDAS